jgi:hypothetical protein
MVKTCDVDDCGNDDDVTAGEAVEAVDAVDTVDTGEEVVDMLSA